MASLTTPIGKTSCTPFYVRQKIQKGVKDFEDGNVVSHEDVVRIYAVVHGSRDLHNDDLNPKN
ncbi:MAG: hypothetical protein JSR44_05840 [Spirochaetes bacterium]|nr:hypothetical protein [Spirochaetota bacterium]